MKGLLKALGLLLALTVLVSIPLWLPALLYCAFNTCK